ncbi:MAG: AzlD domain-containing protein [Lachnospiraceae bacterium]|nr:AzlD domain-containing protein [Lachnospiraceae bacterium]
MNMTHFLCSLLVIAGTTFLIRMIPFVLVRKKIKNRWIRSFLTYIPYAVLTAMTVPAIFFATSSVISGFTGLVTAVILALSKKSLTVVAACSCLVVLVTELILKATGLL